MPVAVATPPPVGSKLHLAGMLLLLFALAGAGFLAQHQATATPAAAPAGQLASHSQAVQFYISAFIIDWALFFYAWFGVRRRHGTLATLSGGRWHSAKDVLVDFGIAVPFWALWEGVSYGVTWLLKMLHPSAAAAIDTLLPKSLSEIVMWILLCLTAGFCEEVVFRGYLQKQFHAFTGSVTAAILLQGIVFGITHGYQGWDNVIVISVLGCLFGILAAWRGNLRVNIISHAWSDIWGGWLATVIFH